MSAQESGRRVLNDDVNEGSTIHSVIVQVCSLYIYCNGSIDMSAHFKCLAFTNFIYRNVRTHLDLLSLCRKLMPVH